MINSASKSNGKPVCKYELFQNYFTKFDTIEITSNFLEFLNKDSILLDEESLKLIDDSIKEHIHELFEEFQSVFIKMDSISCRDCKYILEDLQCFKLDEILILLKSSDKIANFLEKINSEEDSNIRPKLILKKWYRIDPQYEFRCFIKEGRLIGICQRNIDMFFDYEPDQLENIEKIIKEFFMKEDIKEAISKLNNSFLYFDILYLPNKIKIKLIDILSKKELSQYYTEEEIENYNLLFNSNEIDQLECNNCEFRYIKNKDGIVDCGADDYNQFPVEIMEAGSNIEDFIEVMKSKDQAFTKSQH
jgi:hypothetical protein